MTGNCDALPGTLIDRAAGQQFDISHSAHRATVVEVGGGLRQYSVDGPPGNPGGQHDPSGPRLS